MATVTHRLTWVHLSSLCLLVALLVTPTIVHAAEKAEKYDAYDFLMMTEPELATAEFEKQFPNGLLERWFKALDRPDDQLRRMTIDTIAQAHRRGLPGIESAKPRLLQLLGEPDQHYDVTKSVVRALVEFDAREATDDFVKLCETRGDSIRRVVEPVLVDWKVPAMESMWLSRLQQPSASEQLLSIAIQGLGAIKSADATPLLSNLIMTKNVSIPIRMDSALSLGEIGDPTSLELAKKLAGEKSAISAIMTTSLLRNIDSPAAIKILMGLLDNSNSAVHSEVLERLFQIDVSLVDAQADRFVQSKDPNVRRWCLRAMLDDPRSARIKAIIPLLDDVNPSIRTKATEGLLGWAETQKLKDEIIDQAAVVLQKDSWRGCEQAIVVLAKLDHDLSAGRFVELLRHPRGEVKVASAWGLVQLRNRELLPAMLERAEEIYEGFRSGTMTSRMPGITLQEAHLFSAFGDQMYAPAESVMTGYVPKNLQWGTEARAAACWSLGLLKANDPPPELVKEMIQRLNDNAGMEPEENLVRIMCAISLGRMKAESAMGSLQKFAKRDDPVGQACFWAIEQMTGEAPLKPLTTFGRVENWFLGPLRDEAFAK